MVAPFESTKMMMPIRQRNGIAWFEKVQKRQKKNCAEEGGRNGHNRIVERMLSTPKYALRVRIDNRILLN